MKKVMILGAGINQVPIIKLAKERGFETVVVSIPGDYPGLKYADKICEIDITDKEKVLEAAAKEQVDGIVTDQLDFPVPTIAYVTEKLSLPGIGYDCALKFTNKYLMRNECTKLGIKNPEYYRVSTLDEAREKCLDIGLPVIIKPTDSAGSRGIYVIRNINELEDKFKHSIAFSKEDCLIVEKYIEGPEYVIAGFASNYKHTNLMLGKRGFFDISGLFIPNKTLFASVAENDTEKQMLKINNHLIEGFGLKFGVTHCEYIVEERTGEIYLVECAARGAAHAISSDLIPLVTGIDANSLLLDVAVGNAEEIYIQTAESTTVAGYLMFALPEGTIRDIRGIDDIRSLPNVHKVFLDNLHVGMEVGVMTDKGHRMGPILIKGKNKQQYENTIDEIKALLDIDVKTSEGIKGIIW
ncbi:ATP-grasp domain-containing protein [Methanolobus chelungpuianus]|uniref:ATP-grasp domain-containing protein n=1 Tax=Methanolobus chelungpuianus TaxID=502115 RepID=UPI002115A593|nr:ATP-grasp domain-containing protein [Methanolobus chelungpuianus]